MNNLVEQLNALIVEAEASRAAADNWHQLVVLLTERGYGPRITPAQVASVCSNVNDLVALVAETQEAAPAAEATKRSGAYRKRLTPADERRISELALQPGISNQQIAAEIGVTRKVVDEFLSQAD